MLTEGEAYLEHIDSNELKKLIDLLYSSQPEKAVQFEQIKQDDTDNSEPIQPHDKMIRRLDELIDQKK